MARRPFEKLSCELFLLELSKAAVYVTTAAGFNHHARGSELLLERLLLKRSAGLLLLPAFA